ncbi:MAG: glycoside hydrolase [Pirellulaceae bacterium]|nr:glycoside hydrolase [Pirellulaceae bacterium]|tara:strand:+ start:135 stop:1481 length:1347 start_codon:yes stop_codon:yes gene_type:complete
MTKFSKNRETQPRKDQIDATLSRRAFVGSSSALAATGVYGATLSSNAVATEQQVTPPNSTQPVAQPFTIPARQTTKDHYMHDPGMACMEDGTLLVAAPCFEWEHKRVLRNIRSRRKIIHKELLLSRSFDGGETWETLDPMPVEDATPFVHENKFYMFLPGKTFRLVRSDDHGKSWSEPVEILKTPEWNCSTGMTVKDNKLYWAIGGTTAICGDLSRDIMDPQAWRKSNRVGFPKVPDRLRSNIYPPKNGTWPVQWGGDLWLEPNVVNVNGHLRVLSRCVIDEYSTASIGGICDLNDDGEELTLEFTQFAAIPGAQNKFFIMYDEPTQLFWMLSNMPTDSQGYFADRDELLKVGYHGGPGNERRILMLYYSRDSLNWFQAGCAAMWPSPIQAFMYPSAAIVGNDIVFISRTSAEAQNQHDADIVTFHRIRDFRALAMDIFPKLPDGPNV